jgi:acetyltransferase-like isoleucine patch superfamily enzyme
MLISLLRPALKILKSVIRTPSTVQARIDLHRKSMRCRLADGAVLYPVAKVSNDRAREAISIGANSRILARLQTMGHGGQITIGEDCFVGEESYIWSAESITIGDRVLISHGVNIHDGISHSLSAAERHLHFTAIFSGGHPKTLHNVPTAPVVIEDDSWIGFGATVLKGVRIGRGAIVGAQSVVTRDVDPFTIVVGNPARAVGHAKP